MIVETTAVIRLAYVAATVALLSCGRTDLDEWAAARDERAGGAGAGSGGSSSVGHGGGAAGEAGTRECASGGSWCGADCVFLQTDVAHCGSCDSACQVNETCSVGECLCLGPPELMTVTPYVNSIGADERSEVVAYLTCRIADNSWHKRSMRVFSAQSGSLLISSLEQQSHGQIVFAAIPETQRGRVFFPGELVTAWVGSELGGPTSWQFWAATRRANRIGFVKGLQELPSTREIALGDMDSDGDLDLLMRTTTSLEGFANDGLGSFTAAFALALPETLERIVLADFDGDSDLDVFSDHYLQNHAHWLLVDAGATLGLPQSVSDFDGDGDLDVFTGAGHLEERFLLVNDGTGQFTPEARFGTGAVFASAAGDFDRDGDVDLTVVGYSIATQLATATVFFNDGRGRFDERDVGLVSDATRDVVAGDIDGDSDIDLITGSWGAGGARNPSNLVWLNDGTGRFAAGPSVGSGSTDLALGDLDGDGDLDLLAAHHDPYAVGKGWPARVFTNDGAGNFTQAGQFADRYFHRFALGDLDGDGDLDVALSQSGYSVKPAAEIWMHED